MKGREIRRAFLDYFAERGHQVVPSSSLVPSDDPTLLFTNAGMVQFKKVFLGQEKRPYTRAVSCQKCMRAGGKHNDLENVGYTARHHTFFEMLGNFSFGDYFKEEAIGFAWEFLTKYLGLDPKRLYVTVFRDDEEAASLWKKVAGLSESRIVPLGEEDNFWAMGDTGPCGPCSEVIFDQGEEFGCKRPDCRPGCDCDRFLEIWNLVFMQYERTPDGTLKPLPKPSIDTGMGLERIAAVLQGVPSNYDTDLFRGILEALEKLSGRSYGDSRNAVVAFRVIADHIRASTFLVADGVVPSNEGRGYVLRRIIRRAERFGRILGLEEPFLYALVPSVVEEFGDFYPELKRAEETAKKVIRVEEEKFLSVLQRGLEMLEKELKRLKEKGERRISGELVFKMYDTYGFPYDIVRDVAISEGFEVDVREFERLLEEARERGRRNWKGRLATVSEDLRKALEELKETEFTGYENLEESSRVLVLFKDGARVNELSEGEEGILVVEKTPFYAEGGGQVADTGFVEAEGVRVRVEDVKRFSEVILHFVKVTQGRLKVGMEVLLKVDPERRRGCEWHHTATHLLHSALRSVLGEHVRQAGSLVEPDRLRFDFTHFEALSKEEVARVEEFVNEVIREDLEVEALLMPFEEATSTGALALFGEKYGDVVRVVRIGSVSAELCGGTHVRRTGQIGFFKVTSEGSVSAGVRRIEAVCGKAAEDWVRHREELLERLSLTLKCKPEEIPKRVEGLFERIKELERELKRAKSGEVRKELQELLERVKEVKGVKVVFGRVTAGDSAQLREAGDFLRDRIRSGVVFIYSVSDGKVQLLSMVTKDLSSRVSAEEIMRRVAPVVDGRGGGRPEMAQGGGPATSKVGALEKRFFEVLEELL